MKALTSLGKTTAVMTPIILIIAGCQYLLFHNADLLGLDTSLIAADIVARYPQEALWAFIVTIGLTTCMTSLWIWITCFTARNTNQTIRRSIWFISTLSASMLALSHLISYPAIYEGFLPMSLRKMVFALSFIISPEALKVSGLLWLLLPIWDLSKTRKKAAALGLALLIISAVATGLLSTTTSTRPQPSTLDKAATQANIVIIAVDALRQDRFLDENIAPNLHELLYDRQAVLFLDHIVGTPRTFPSWIEILTGKYAVHTGVRHMFPNLKSRRQTFTSFVSHITAAGYQSTVISDFAGDIFPRFDAGFQKVDAPNGNLETNIRMNTMLTFPLFIPFIANDFVAAFLGDLRVNPAFSSPKELTQKAIAFLEQKPNTPKLMTVFYSTVHFPYASPWPYYSLYADPAYAGPFWFQKNPEIGLKRSDAHPQEAQIQQVNHLYDGAVTAVDHSIGELVRWLKRENTWDNTLLVITADHGQDLYEPGRYHGHGEHLFGPNVTQVPLLLKMPRSSGVPGRTRIQFTTRSVDLAPTVLDILGVSALPDIDGTSLSRWIFDDNLDEPRLPAYSETGMWFSKGDLPGSMRLGYPGVTGLLDFDPGFSGEITLNRRFEDIVVVAKHRSLVHENFKLIYLPTDKGAKFMLFDRNKDPGSHNDISLKHPKVLSFLKNKLLEHIKDSETGHYTLMDQLLVPTY